MLAASAAFSGLLALDNASPNHDGIGGYSWLATPAAATAVLVTVPCVALPRMVILQAVGGTVTAAVPALALAAVCRASRRLGRRCRCRCRFRRRDGSRSAACGQPPTALADVALFRILRCRSINSDRRPAPARGGGIRGYWSSLGSACCPGGTLGALGSDCRPRTFVRC